MKILKVISSSNEILDALTTVQGVSGRFYKFQSKKRHAGPHGTVELNWLVTYALEPAEGGMVRLTLSYREFPSNSRTEIDSFYKKVHHNIEQLCQKKGVSVEVNLIYRPKYEDNKGTVTPK